MKWLARMEIDVATAYAQAIFDNYDWHRRIWDCFPSTLEARRNFLTRVDPLDGAYQVWILSSMKPVCPHWCREELFACKAISPGFLSHSHYIFDVRTNPVKAIVQRDPDGRHVLNANGKRRSGKRVPIVKHEELRQWLIRKGQVRCLDGVTGEPVPGGFRIVDNRPLEISPMVREYFHKKGHTAYHGGVRFRGTLEVTDREYFIKTYESGIGAAKGFGFGLLLLAPISL